LAARDVGALLFCFLKMPVAACRSSPMVDDVTEYLFASGLVTLVGLVSKERHSDRAVRQRAFSGPVYPNSRPCARRLVRLRPVLMTSVARWPDIFR